jgi:hypothetical protein
MLEIHKACIESLNRTKVSQILPQKIEKNSTLDENKSHKRQSEKKTE